MKRGNGITVGYLRDAGVDEGRRNPSQDCQENLVHPGGGGRRFAIAPPLPALITKM